MFAEMPQVFNPETSCPLLQLFAPLTAGWASSLPGRLEGGSVGPLGEPQVGKESESWTATLNVHRVTQVTCVYRKEAPGRKGLPQFAFI